MFLIVQESVAILPKWFFICVESLLFEPMVSRFAWTLISANFRWDGSFHAPPERGFQFLLFAHFRFFSSLNSCKVLVARVSIVADFCLAFRRVGPLLFRCKVVTSICRISFTCRINLMLVIVPCLVNLISVFLQLLMQSVVLLGNCFLTTRNIYVINPIFSNNREHWWYL